MIQRKAERKKDGSKSELLEMILSEENILPAMYKVIENRGAGGIDGVTTRELEEYYNEHWEGIKEGIRNRTYKPQPVMRVEIPKKSGGVRKLGIPTVIDRTIEQAIVQVLAPIFEEHSVNTAMDSEQEEAANRQFGSYWNTLKMERHG